MAKGSAKAPAKKAPPAKPKVSEIDLEEDLAEDPRNANAGTERGHAMLERSVGEFGAGRGIVVDANGLIVAGNKTREALVAAGMKKAIVVETDGQTPVVVKRSDFDLREKGGKARRYAYADNRVGEVDLSWDAAQLRADVDDGLDLSDFFSEKEFENLTKDADSGGPPDDFAEPDAETACQCPSCGFEFTPSKRRDGE